jgi:hypothetical protein
MTLRRTYHHVAFRSPVSGAWVYLCHDTLRGPASYDLNTIALDAVKFSTVADLTRDLRVTFDDLARRTGLGPIDWSALRVTAVEIIESRSEITWNAVSGSEPTPTKAGPAHSEADLIEIEQICRQSARAPARVSPEMLERVADIVQAMHTRYVDLSARVAGLEEEVEAYRLAYTMPDDPDWLKRLAEGGEPERMMLTAYMGREPQHLDLNQKVWDWGQIKDSAKARA